MSRQKAGLRKEHELANEIYDISGGNIIPLRAGWSGNNAPPMPDLLIPYRGSLRALELKTSNQRRLVIEQDDIADIVDWAMNMNEVPTFPYITIKFMMYEAVTMRIYKPWDVEDSLEILAEYVSPFDTNLTRGGNISFGHPTHYDCEVTSSQKSPGDGAAVLRDLQQDSFAHTDGTTMETVSVYDVISRKQRALS